MKRLNRVDACISLILLISVAGILWQRTEKPAEEHFWVQAEWSGAPAETADCLEEGDLLYTEAGELFGRVEQIAREDAPSIRVTVSVAGALADGVLYRDGARPIYVGEAYRLFSDRVSMALRILSYASEPSSLSREATLWETCTKIAIVNCEIESE